MFPTISPCSPPGLEHLLLLYIGHLFLYFGTLNDLNSPWEFLFLPFFSYTLSTPQLLNENKFILRHVLTILLFCARTFLLPRKIEHLESENMAHVSRHLHSLTNLCRYRVGKKNRYSGWRKDKVYYVWIIYYCIYILVTLQNCGQVPSL